MLITLLISCVTVVLVTVKDVVANVNLLRSAKLLMTASTCSSGTSIFHAFSSLTSLQNGNVVWVWMEELWLLGFCF